MAEKVGQIYYEVDLDTRKLIEGQRRVDQEVKKTGSSLDGLSTKLTAVAAAAAALAAAFAAIHLAKMADEFRLLGARVEVAAGNLESGATALSALVKISRDTQSSLAGNIEVFTRLNQSILQMGGTQRDTLLVTELLAKAIKVSGASAVEAKAAMLQFGQALGSGKLQGDELRSLMETAPYLMRQLADGIGVPVGALKKLGEEGKLTADVVTNALVKAAAKIDADFKKFPQTIESAMVVSQDAAGLAATKFDELSGSSAAVTGVVKGMGEVLTKLADQFGAANDQAGVLGRNAAVRGWADASRQALSYLADAADVVWQTLSVLGRNVAFVFEGAGKEIGGIGAQVMAVLRGDFAGARAISDAMVADSEQRRKALEAADAKTLGRAKLAGQAMREAWEQGAGGGRGVVNPEPAASTLKSPVDKDAANKAASRRAAAQAYYLGLVADNKSALQQIDADEQKALADNERRRTADAANADIYAKAKVEIVKKYARERALLEERSQQEIAELNIATTTNEMARVEAIRVEAIRRIAAAERLGTMTHEQAERERALVTFKALEAAQDLQERNARARADGTIAVTQSQEQRIKLIRDEAIRSAEEGYRRGRMTFEEAEAAKTRAVQEAVDQQKALTASRTQTSVETLQIRADTTGSPEAQIELIRAQAAAQLAVVQEAQLRDLEATQIYADQKAAIIARMNQQITDINAASATAQLAMAGNAAGQMLSLLKQSGRERTGLGKALFAAERALAVATIIMQTEVGAAKAVGQTGIFGISLATLIRAQGYASAGMVAGMAIGELAGGRQYGGPVSAGSMYKINEGGQPEMFVGRDGGQYMLPTKSGSVTPADQVGGSQAPTIIIQNMGTPQTVSSQSYDQATNTAKIVMNDLVRQFSNNEGPAWRALTGSSNVRTANL